MRSMDPNNMPTSVAHKLSDDMFKTAKDGSHPHHENNSAHNNSKDKQPREILEYKATLTDDFLTHHLKH